MSLINIEAFRNAKLQTEPYKHGVVPNFIPAEAIARIMPDYPHITQGGSFPLSSLEYGPEFDQLCQELRGPALRDAFAERFGLDLSNRPTTLTVRGLCRAKDGKIHTDSKSKIITVLIYLNGLDNRSDGGQLRLLRGPDDINDYAVQVPPEPGKMLFFLNGPTAWHGHTSFTGARRVMQLNWVTDEAAVRKSERRHGLSAIWKKLNPFRSAA